MAEEAKVRMTSPGSTFLKAALEMSSSAAITRSRMKRSISERRSRFASASGVCGSILMMTVVQVSRRVPRLCHTR